MERNLNIDLAKCIACIGVVGLHGIGMANYTLYYLCSFAVPMFFMINGYLMFQKESVSFKYAGKKILSYLKLILCWNILLIIPVMLLRHKLINPLTECIRSIMQQGYLWHFWFFGSMIALLILLPLVHKMIKGRVTHNAVIVVALFIACIAVTISSWRDEYPNQAFVPQFLRIWMYGFYYLAGALISQSGFTEKSKENSSKAFTYVTGILTVVLAYVANMGQKHLGNYRYHNRLAEFFYDEGTVMIWCVVFFIFILSIKSVRFEKAVSSFSAISLGVFIIHPLVLKAAEILALQDTTVTAVLRFAAVTLISSLIAFLMSKIPFVRGLIRL